MLHCHYLSSLCQRRHWPLPRYDVSYTGKGYRCVVRVNNREYQTTQPKPSEDSAREAAALIAFMICRNFSANDGMYPTGFAHDGVIQGNPVPVGSGRHHNNRDSNSSLEGYYGSESTGSRSGGSSPDVGTRRLPAPAVRSSRHSASVASKPSFSRHGPEQNRHPRHY